MVGGFVGKRRRLESKPWDQLAQHCSTRGASFVHLYFIIFLQCQSKVPGGAACSVLQNQFTKCSLPPEVDHNRIMFYYYLYTEHRVAIVSLMYSGRERNPTNIIYQKWSNIADQINILYSPLTQFMLTFPIQRT